MFPKRNYESVLFFLAVFWALFFSFVLQLTPGFSKIGDDGSYLIAARLLYFDLKLDNVRPLLISAIQGLPYLFGFSDQAVIKWGIFVNFCCWTGTVFLVFGIVSDRIDRKIGFVAAILFILCVGNLAHAFNFLSESVFIFGIVSSVYFANRYALTKNISCISLAIAVSLLNVLIKPVAIGIAVLVIVFHIRIIYKHLMNTHLLFIFLGLLLIFIQMYAMKRTYGDFTLGYASPIAYYNYLGAKADCLDKGIDYRPSDNERTRRFFVLSSHEMKKKAATDLKDQIQNNTVNFFKAYGFCMYSNTAKGNFIVSECKNQAGTAYFGFFHFLFKAVSKLQNVIFTIVGVLLSLYGLLRFRREKPFYLLVSGLILYVFLVSAISCFQCDRFHIAFFPLVLILLTKFIKPAARPF